MMTRPLLLLLALEPLALTSGGPRHKNTLSQLIASSTENNTMASSGSRLGSTPNSKLLDVLGPAAVGALPPSSSGILALRSAESIGDEIRESESKCDPGGTVRRCL